MDPRLFKEDPRAYLQDLLDQGVLTAERMVELFMCHMTRDDIADMLDAEELSPRFFEYDSEADEE